jgi:hypothetical protein
MDFDYEFFKDLVLTMIAVIIPVIGGAVTTRKITSLWQIKNEKSKIKREVLSDFQNSAKRVYDITISFIGMIFDEYVQYDHKLNEKIPKGHAILEFPTNSDEFPKKKFQNEYKKFQSDIRESTFHGSRFLSSLRLYYRNQQLEEEYEKIHEQLASAVIRANYLITTTTEDDFFKIYERCMKDLSDSKTLMRSFELKLADTELNKLIM